MRRLADTSQRLVADSVQTTRLSQDMYAQIALLERSARLYQVLGDPTRAGARFASTSHAQRDRRRAASGSCARRMPHAQLQR